MTKIFSVIIQFLFEKVPIVKLMNGYKRLISVVLLVISLILVALESGFCAISEVENKVFSLCQFFTVISAGYSALLAKIGGFLLVPGFLHAWEKKNREKIKSTQLVPNTEEMKQ